MGGAESVGIYHVFGDIILPFLLYALDGQSRSHPDSALQPDTRDTEHRRFSFRAQSQWRQIPDRGSSGLLDLITRLYEVLDLWSASPDRDVRDAVFIELIEAGYSDLTVQDLLRHAGPRLKKLAGRTE